MAHQFIIRYFYPFLNKHPEVSQLRKIIEDNLIL